jgi:nitrogen fixation protein FixH
MKRNPWPYAIVLYFVVFIAAIVAWIAFAVRNEHELVRSDYYEQEIKFQKDIDGQSRAAGVNIDVSYNSTQQSVTISLPTPADSGSIYFYRPSDAKADCQIALALKDGSQTIDVRDFKDGLWKIRFIWTQAGVEYRHNCSLVFAPTTISLR